MLVACVRVVCVQVPPSLIITCVCLTRYLFHMFVILGTAGPLRVDAEVYEELRATGAFDTMTVREDEVSTPRIERSKVAPHSGSPHVAHSGGCIGTRTASAICCWWYDRTVAFCGEISPLGVLNLICMPGGRFHHHCGLDLMFVIFCMPSDGCCQCRFDWVMQPSDRPAPAMHG